MPLLRRLERYFEFKALGADWRTEILAGFTTFMTMAYGARPLPEGSTSGGSLLETFGTPDFSQDLNEFV